MFIYGSLIVSMETWAKHFIFYINKGRFVSILHQFQCALSKTNTKIKDFSKTDFIVKRQQSRPYHTEAVPVNPRPQWKTSQDGQRSADHLCIRDQIEKSQTGKFAGEEFIARRSHHNFEVTEILAMRPDKMTLTPENECRFCYPGFVRNLEICTTQSTSKV